MLATGVLGGAGHAGGAGYGRWRERAIRAYPEQARGAARWEARTQSSDAALDATLDAKMNRVARSQRVQLSPDEAVWLETRENVAEGVTRDVATKEKKWRRYVRSADGPITLAYRPAGGGLLPVRRRRRRRALTNVLGGSGEQTVVVRDSELKTWSTAQRSATAHPCTVSRRPARRGVPRCERGAETIARGPQTMTGQQPDEMLVLCDERIEMLSRPITEQERGNGWCKRNRKQWLRYLDSGVVAGHGVEVG